MAAIPTKQGDIMPLMLQLGRGLTGLFPQAILKNQAGTILATVDLDDIGDGTYNNNVTQKNADMFTIVVYKVFEDAAHTIPAFSIEEDSGDNDSMDIFWLLEEAGLLIRRDHFHARFKPIGEIRGKIRSDKLKGRIESEDMKATIPTQKMNGRFEPSELRGKFKCSGS